MTITICGSMSFSKEMLEAQKELEEKGHTVHMPDGAEEYSQGKIPVSGGSEGAQRKVEYNLIKQHYDLIKESDAILVINHDRRGIKNYIGGNAFLEMGFAHVLGKKIYLTNPIPDMDFIKEELEAMQPIILDNNSSNIR